jgi:hypothetical protein
MQLHNKKKSTHYFLLIDPTKAISTKKINKILNEVLAL